MSSRHGSAHAPSPSTSSTTLPTKFVEDDDKQSDISRLSGSPRTERVLDALQLVAGNRVRHARCAPEFLDDLATRGPNHHSKKLAAKKFKIISGVEARHYFKTFISDTVIPDTDPHARTLDEPRYRTRDDHIPSPIVFAVTVWDAGRKCVDYYMTWRNKSMPTQWKDFETRIAQLDAEFRQLAKSLDKEFKRISSLKNGISLNHRSSEKSKHSSLPTQKPRAPPDITVSKPEQSSDEINPGLLEPPASAADSVMSLPLLNMIRGVPFSHRVPLRVTNPDRFSMISEAESPVITEPPKDAVPEPKEITNDIAALDIAEPRTRMSLAVPVMNQRPVFPHSNYAFTDISNSSRHNSSDEDVKRSSASILSSDTKSNRSSRSSRSSVENVPHRSSTKTHAAPSSDVRKTSDHHHHSRREKPRDEPLFEFTIVVLGDKLERDTTTWHGLLGQTSLRDVPAERHSPWTGPVSRPASTQYSRTVDSESDESDDESQAHGEFGYHSNLHPHLPPAPPPSHASWGTTPVIPMKPLMEAMGYIPSSSSYYYQGTPVVPPGSQYAASVMSSPAPNGSPYLYSTPRLDSSPYLPGWTPLHHMSSPMPSRPPSRAYSAHSGHSVHSYGSPYASPRHSPPF